MNNLIRDMSMRKKCFDGRIKRKDIPQVNTFIVHELR